MKLLHQKFRLGKTCGFERQICWSLLFLFKFGGIEQVGNGGSRRQKLQSVVTGCRNWQLFGRGFSARKGRLMSVGKTLQKELCADLPDISATLGTAQLGRSEREFLTTEPRSWGL